MSDSFDRSSRTCAEASVIYVGMYRKMTSFMQPKSKTSTRGEPEYAEPAFTADAEGAIIGCNDEFHRITGLGVGDSVEKVLQMTSGFLQDLHAKDLLAEPLLVYHGPLTYEGDQGRRLAHASIFPLQTRDRARLVGVIRDDAFEEARYGAVLDRIGSGVILFNRDVKIVFANSKAKELVGIEHASGSDKVQFFYQDETPMLRDEMPVPRTFRSGKPIRNYVLGVKAPDSEAINWLMCNTDPYVDDGGQIAYVLVTFTDVTELKEAQRRLHASEERLRLVLQGSTDAPWDVNLITGEIYFSPRWWQMIGREHIDGATSISDWFDFIHAEDRQRVIAKHQRALEDGSVTYEIEFRIQHADNSYIPILARAYILRDETGRATRVSGTNADLSERKRTEEKIYRLGFFDPLTEIPNRRLLIERLGQAIRRSERSSSYGGLLFIDLDNFKILNDSRGHDIGDILLKQVAIRLTECIRGADTIARLGGDEFVIVLEHISPNAQDAALAAERACECVLEAIRAPYILDEIRHETSASIGVTLFRGGDLSVDGLLKQADLAMYEAKRTGRNRMRFFDNAMQIAIARRVSVEAELRDAIGNGQLLLCFQPQIRLPAYITGAEALLRWEHPVRGTLAPNSFISIAEETGLIVPIGEWVLQEACKTASEWAMVPSLRHLIISVNVSIRQFQEANFAEKTIDIVARSAANPSQLRFEITESVLVADIEDVIAKMATLRAAGFSFSLDDFGTGYSSLLYLQRMPLAELKIDRSFVHELITNENHRAIARAIVTLAKTLGLEVVAEGVETENQRDFLHQLGCSVFQGFLFGRPKVKTEFEAEISSGRQFA